MHDHCGGSVSCAEVDALLGFEDVHAAPSAARRREVEHHLAHCERCSGRWAADVAVVASIAEEPAPVVAPPMVQPRATASWRRVAGLVAASLVAGVLVVRPWCVATDGMHGDDPVIPVEVPAPPAAVPAAHVGEFHPVAVREKIIVERALPGGRIAREVHEVVRMEIRK